MEEINIEEIILLYIISLWKVVWCEKFNPIWTELSNCENEININKENMYEINGPNNNNLTNKYNVDGYPTIILVKNNKINKYEGNRELEDLKRWILSC